MEEDYSNMTKAEKKKLKKQRKLEEKEKERSERQRGQRNRKIKNYGILFLVILAVVGFFYWRSIPPENAPIISVEPTLYDFGTVSQAKGIVSTTLDIYNRGNQDLVLRDMDTSCMCTTAAVIANGVEGPKFGMRSHGTNPKDWEQVIPPGESVQLKIYYNPNAHKDLKGSVTRSISLYSNDPMNKKKEVKIKAFQVS